MKLSGSFVWNVIVYGFGILLIWQLASCSNEKVLFFNRYSVKNYPVDTPFVFDNTLKIKGSLPKDEKKKLLLGLESHWHDSIDVPKMQRFGLFYRIKNPPVFDSTKITASVQSMNAYLQSQGYYRASFDDTFYFKQRRKQQRTYVNITILPGKPTVIDSFGYDFRYKTLQNLSNRFKSRSNIIPGKTLFSVDNLNDELNRLVKGFRQHGYFLMTRDQLYVEADTIQQKLLDITVNPFEQVETILQAQQQKINKPTASVTVKDTLLNNDSAAFKQYHIGNIYFYPETGYNELPDSLLNKPLPILYKKNEFTIYSPKKLFVPKPLLEHVYMRKGNLYNENAYIRTVNNLNAIGAWQQVDVRTNIRKDTVDFHYFLVPAVKQNFTVDLELSRNTGDFLTVGNLFGLAVNTTYRNRNVWKRAIQSATTLRNGIELNLNGENSFLQTFQSSFSHTYTFPSFIAPFQIKAASRVDAMKTLIGLNAAYSERRNFFRLRSLITGWGYEWKNRNRLWQYKPLNIELYSLDTLAGLDTAFQTNPFLRTAFNTGSIVSQVLSFNVNYRSPNHPVQTNNIRLSVEEAGALAGRIKGLQDNIYQYLKFEAEFIKHFTFQKTEFAFRAYGGVGYNYGKAPNGKTLPFYKQFIAGGPNSMRAWGLRQLGLGSSLISDTAGTKNNAFRDRYGDVQLEMNFEYRYRLTSIGSMNIDGALFTDVGNIWNLKKDSTNPNSEFSFSRLGKDIAIGVGTGLRFDFSFFLIRIDFGLKLKDPARLSNNGWLSISDFTWKNYEFQRKDVNGKVISPSRNNYAIQLGIGLPF
jgi:outer membrane protein assembly factor BamA